ncbi:VOC family protein [Nocardioides sp. 503]|uniref:bleomycin resistance protein n=1 Tax=Nocardioides sp. 503 TaxID=2508326 RepID=UPI00106F4708|nr:VOC family protein [Nocardioides sp. 503]
MTTGAATPALPVRDIEAAVQHYADRFGFACPHRDDGFAILTRDETFLHLWAAGDDGWRLRPEQDLRDSPVSTGAETFIAGTASCRIHVTDVDALHAELAARGVLHPTDPGAPTDTDWGTRELAALDLDGNLLTFFQQR